MFFFVCFENINASDIKTDSSFNTTGTVEEQDLHKELKREDVTNLLQYANNLLIMSKDTLFSDEVTKSFKEIATKVITEVKKESDRLKDLEPDTTWEVYKESGSVSWYGDPAKKLDRFHGRKSANGEVFDTYKYTVASWSDLKFGTIIKMTNPINGNTVVARVTDRGAFKKLGRVLDLSYACMRDLGGLGSGVIKVKVEVLKSIK